MATGTDAIILAALSDHLGTLSFTPALTVAWPGVPFPAAGAAKPDNYLAVSFLPNKTRTITYGAESQQHHGIFQVSVFWIAGQGVIPPLNAADQIIEHFAMNTVLMSGAVKITIEAKPWASGPFQSGDRVQVPVSIPYHAFG